MKTKVSFIDPLRVKIETQDGEVFILGHNNDMNYQIEQNWNCFYSTFVAKLFDKYYNGNEASLWGNIARGMYNNRISPFTWVVNDRNKERERIGNRIKELRKEKNIEAKDLAQRTGIDPGNLSRIEQGRFSVGFDILNKIANAMDMRIDFVLKDNENSSKNAI